MSDISIPISSRAMNAQLDAQLPVTIDRKATADTPLGLWATIAWGAAGIGALYLTWLIPIVLNAVTGAPVAMPALFLHLPVDHIAVAAVVMAALWFNRRPLRQYLAMSALRLGGVGRSIGIGLAAYVGFVILIGVLEVLRSSGVDVEQSVPAVPKIVIDTAMILSLMAYWFVLVVAAPIVEEMLFRGLLYRGLEAKIGALATVVITSVLFGMVHYLGFGWPRAVATGCLGLLLGVVRWRTGNTTAAVVVHATINFAAASFFTATILLAAWIL
jgi:membrane protease YdiL (CAAX protease family)